MTFNDNIAITYLELTATDTIKKERMSIKHTAMNVKAVASHSTIM